MSYYAAIRCPEHGIIKRVPAEEKVFADATYRCLQCGRICEAVLIDNPPQGHPIRLGRDAKPIRNPLR